ncbi:MAG: CHAD domain-containing protein [Woeseiaceae bacterium]|nr:CHAD domain-containing protein [Woeseiaceae bacterium]
MAEIEAKFLVRRPGQVDAALAALATAGIEAEAGQPALQLDTYYDTRDWTLYRHGVAFRRRQRGSDTMLTLKSLDGAGGPVFVRDEVEQALGDAPADLLPPGPVANRLAELGAPAPGRKLFSVRTRRKSWHLRHRDAPDSEFRLDVDETVIRPHRPRAGAAGRLAFTELELELVTGPVARLQAAAELLAAGTGLVPARMGKFDRGLLAGGFVVPEADAEIPGRKLTRHDRVTDLLFRELSGQARILAAQEPVAWEGIDPEGVHGMRVATRRIRALLREFRDLVPARPLEKEFRWLARRLGVARDADVGMHDYQVHAALLPAETVAELDAVERQLREAQVAAHELLDTVFPCDRYRSLMALFRAFIADGSATRDFDAPTIEAAAADRVTAIAARVIARGDALGAAATAAELHALRIIAKRLRYLLELFGTVQTRRWRRAIAAVQSLHDILGTHQDAVTGLERLTACTDELAASERTPAFDAALGALEALEKKRIAACRDQFPAAWSRVRLCLA